jgi:hypothetical protein
VRVREESDQDYHPISAGAPDERGGGADADRHVIVVDRDNRRFFELYRARRKGNEWTAVAGAIFDLGSNTLHPSGRRPWGQDFEVVLAGSIVVP